MAGPVAALAHAHGTDLHARAGISVGAGGRASGGGQEEEKSAEPPEHHASIPDRRGYFSLNSMSFASDAARRWGSMPTRTEPSPERLT
jgi:hypothetical protein